MVDIETAPAVGGKVELDTWGSFTAAATADRDDLLRVSEDGAIVAWSRTAKMPTPYGTFNVRAFRDRAHREHVVLFQGELAGQALVPVRVHSECLTSEVLGSLRCDCKTQLDMALAHIAERRIGMLIYLRQEGRGTGLVSKIDAYALQDTGLDTVEASGALGVPVDARTYELAGEVIRLFDIASISLLTNNPAKDQSLQEAGRRGRSPHPDALRAERVQRCLSTHQEIEDEPSVLSIAARNQVDTRVAGSVVSPMTVAPCDVDFEGIAADVMAVIDRVRHADARWPCVTLSYAQSLDGSIAGCNGETLGISGGPALDFTHRLRAMHDAILVGVNTVLTDNPRLTVRRVEGPNPRPVVVDSHLRTPLDSRILQRREAATIVTTSERVPEEGRVARGAWRRGLVSAQDRNRTRRPSGALLASRRGRHHIGDG